MNFAVIFNYTFDNDIAVYLFETKEEAIDFLQESFTEEVRIDTEENGYTIKAEISDDGCEAYIMDYFDDHQDTTFMRIGTVYQ